MKLGCREAELRNRNATAFIAQWSLQGACIEGFAETSVFADASAIAARLDRCQHEVFVWKDKLQQNLAYFWLALILLVDSKNI